ncbi:RNA polymerase sigma factor [Amycolatopsis rubida]|uniref:RNA polymerase sigma-70 factor, ECF subfamily n=1 Tax=Amycolatopsis rubida TaxID=112413 RepID=A0A1I5X670_9PSEU|nr:hypothetical protein [Amycolatopsis rubida]SFQ27472.1 RNA polymerase sigma-70 factor, ECF subfamily [Amycolatopsis rubida]
MPGSSFDAFFADDFPRLKGFLISLGYEASLSEDAAAEAMYRAHEDWGSIEHPGAWVRIVAKREALHQAMRDQDGIKKAVEGGWVPPERSPEDPPRIVEALLRRQEMLRTLPDQQREVMAWARRLRAHRDRQRARGISRDGQVQSSPCPRQAQTVVDTAEPAR